MFGRSAGFGYISPKIFAKFMVGFLKLAGVLIFATMLFMAIKSGNILAYISFGLFALSIISYLIFKKRPNNTFLFLSIVPILLGFILAIIILAQLPTLPSAYKQSDSWIPW